MGKIRLLVTTKPKRIPNSVIDVVSPSEDRGHTLPVSKMMTFRQALYESYVRAARRRKSLCKYFLLSGGQSENSCLAGLPDIPSTLHVRSGLSR